MPYLYINSNSYISILLFTYFLTGEHNIWEYITSEKLLKHSFSLYQEEFERNFRVKLNDFGKKPQHESNILLYF